VFVSLRARTSLLILDSGVCNTSGLRRGPMLCNRYRGLNRGLFSMLPSLRGRRSKGKGEGEFEREARQRARSAIAIVGLGNSPPTTHPHDRASRSNSPFPFPFERRPRRLYASQYHFPPLTFSERKGFAV